MRAIFISYRQADSPGEAGRLFDDLQSEFGEGSVFMDVSGIEVGRDFRKAIDQSVASCAVLLAVIGREWLTVKDELGQLRLNNPSDFVRLETAAALKRDIPVIPICVRGAKVPPAEQLPEDIKELAYRNGVELTHARWGSDLQLLIKALRPHVRPPAGPTVEPKVAPSVEARAEPKAEPPQPVLVPPTKEGWKLRSAMVLAVLALVIIGAFVLWPKTEHVTKRFDSTIPAPDQDIASEPKPGPRIPDFAGLWTETGGWKGQMRLKVVQKGNQIGAYISYTQIFEERPSFVAEINEGRAVVAMRQGCAPPNQSAGYNYENPGENIFTITLRGSIMVYEQTTKWNSPCGGHKIGVEKTTKELQREST